MQSSENQPLHGTTVGRLAAALLDRRFAKFIAIGVTNFIISYLAFRIVWSLLGDQPSAVAAAQLLSYAAGIIWSFFWNRRITFAGAGNPRKQFVRFFLLQIFLALASAWMLSFAVGALHLPASPAWFVVMSCITVTNFLVSRYIVFT